MYPDGAVLKATPAVHVSGAGGQPVELRSRTLGRVLSMTENGTASGSGVDGYFVMRFSHAIQALRAVAPPALRGADGLATAAGHTHSNRSGTMVGGGALASRRARQGLVKGTQASSAALSAIGGGTIGAAAASHRKELAAQASAAKPKGPKKMSAKAARAAARRGVGGDQGGS